MKIYYILITVIVILSIYYLFSRLIEPFDDSNLFEGCVKYPQFAMSSSNSPGGGAGKEFGSATSPYAAVTAGQMDVLKYLQSLVAEMKTKVPVNFVLGKLTNTDASSNIIVNPDMDVRLPNIRMNFNLSYPTEGPTGPTGTNAPMRGDTGDTGPTGPVGESGYWGTIKDTLY